VTGGPNVLRCKHRVATQTKTPPKGRCRGTDVRHNIAPMSTRQKIAFACAGVMAISAVVAFFAGGHRGAAIIAGQTGVAFCLAYAAAKKDLKKAAEGK